jgi:hypothetical protein
MCRPCLYTAHVYKDDVTLYLGSYYIYAPHPLNIVHMLWPAVGWVDIGTRTKVPLKFVTYLT